MLKRKIFITIKSLLCTTALINHDNSWLSRQDVKTKHSSFDGKMSESNSFKISIRKVLSQALEFHGLFNPLMMSNCTMCLAPRKISQMNAIRNSLTCMRKASCFRFCALEETLFVTTDVLAEEIFQKSC